MGLFDFIRGEFIDVIEWTDDSHDTIVFRFPVRDHAIKMGAQLTVREGQAAVFVNEGRLADVFTPGRYELAPPHSTKIGDDHARCSVSARQSSSKGVLPGQGSTEMQRPASSYSQRSRSALIAIEGLSIART